jgi:hypothetical protein
VEFFHAVRVSSGVRLVRIQGVEKASAGKWSSWRAETGKFATTTSR